MAKPTQTTAATCPYSFVDERTVIDALVSSGELSDQSLPRVIGLIRRFCWFGARAFAFECLRDATPASVQAFVTAPSSKGDPAVATMHLRRSALRLLFRTARRIDATDDDPTVDLELPPRSASKARPLTRDEVEVCRAASLHSLNATRLPAAWALAEATARSSELGHVRARDVDLDQQQVWLRGTNRTEARWAPTTAWGCAQLERRLRSFGNDPDRPLVYDGSAASNYHRQAASCMAISEVMHRSGVASEPDVRPVSVAAWAGRELLIQTGRIDEVARRLGVRSLDRAAAMIAWEWASGEPTGV
jgi:integrase